jgi:hypothetical protein
VGHFGYFCILRKNLEDFGPDLNKKKSICSSNSSRENEPLWSTAKMKDELVTQLALASVCTKNDQFGFTHVLFKYYERAAFWMYRIPLARTVLFFDIDLDDLSIKLTHELAELKKPDPRMFWYVVKIAVVHIFENINFEYFHRSVMRDLKIRFVRGNSTIDAI